MMAKTGYKAGVAAAKKKRGFGGACAIVVEQAGSKRKVVADMAEARTLVKRLAERHPTKQVKVTRACSTGRGARGETLAACTGRKCWGALSGAPRGGVRGTREQHQEQVEAYLRDAEFFVDQAQKTKGASRRGLALRAFKRVEQAEAVCGWAGGNCNEEVIGLREEVLPMLMTSKAERKAYDDHTGFLERQGRGVRGVSGTTAQHEKSASDYAAAAQRAIKHASETRDAKMRRTFLRTAQKQVDAGQTECTWVAGRGLEPKACREVREAAEALYFAKTKRRPRGTSSGTRRKKWKLV